MRMSSGLASDQASITGRKARPSSACVRGQLSTTRKSALSTSTVKPSHCPGRRHAATSTTTTTTNASRIHAARRKTWRRPGAMTD